jgi:Ulp1 family protease
MYNKCNFFFKRFGNIDYFGGLVTVNNNHWTLCFADIKEKIFYYIDSLKDNSIVNNTPFESWKKFCATRKGLSSNNWKLSQPKFICQKDSYNCGVFVCHFFSLLINRQVDLLNLPIDINCFRSEIYKTIFSYKL